MLTKEHSIQIGDYVFYRDFQDEEQYYYLPTGDVRIADNGKKLHYVVTVDKTISEIKANEEGSSPIFVSTESFGYLSLEVELGPTEKELEELKTKLKEQVGENVKLSPVDFEDGDVRFTLLATVKNAKEEAKDENTVTSAAVPKISIVGSTKPSLIGRQTSVFSAKLPKDEAQIMWNLLKGTPQTQMMVSYDLYFKGIMPAYYLKITVDFSATEEYWRHHFEADLDFNYDKDKKGNEDNKNIDVAIAADVDVDIMMRDLINDGKIIIEEIDYKGDEVSRISANDQNALEIVKTLLSEELFKTTTLPSDDYSALSNVVNNVKGSSEDGKKDEKDAEKKPESDKNPTTDKKTTTEKNSDSKAENKKQPDATNASSSNAAKTNPNESTGKVTGAAKPSLSANASSNKTLPEFDDVAKGDNIITEQEWKGAGLEANDFTKLAQKFMTEEQFKNYKLENYLKEFDTMNTDKNGGSKLKRQEWEAAGLDSADFNAYKGRDNAESTSVSKNDYKAYLEEKGAARAYAKIAGNNAGISLEVWKKEKLDASEFERFAKDSEPVVTKEKYNEYKASKDKEIKNNTEKQCVSEAAKESIADAQQTENPATVCFKFDAKLGYTYKKRSLSEQKTRTYIFNKRMAQRYGIHPSGLITTENTGFDSTKQVTVVNLNDQKFKEVRLTFNSTFDFDNQHIKDCVINFRLPDGRQDSAILNKNNEIKEFIFNSEDYDDKGMDYSVDVNLSDGNNIIGYGDSKKFRKEYSGVNERAISITRNDLADLNSFTVQLGKVTLTKPATDSDAGMSSIKSVDLIIYSKNKESGSLLREHTVTLSGNRVNQSEVLYLNPELEYVFKVLYRFDNLSFRGIKCDKSEITVSLPVSKDKELTIQDPVKGMILVRTLLGEATFGNELTNVIVTMKKGNDTQNINLNEDAPEHYFAFDYEPGDPEPIVVESIMLVKIEDGARKLVNADLDPKSFKLTCESVDLNLPII